MSERALDMSKRLTLPHYSTDLIIHLVAREFRLRYRRALLGWMWVIAEPLARLITLAFVFSRIVPQHIPNFTVFLFTGILAWSWFAAAIASMSTSAVERRDLLFRPGLPRYTVALVSALSDSVDYLSALPLLLAFLVLGPGIPLTAIALPLVLANQLALILGLGFALCAANVYLRDVRLLVNVALLLGFYVTPVFYARGRVPLRYRWIIDLNPMSQLIEDQRRLLLDGRLPALVPFMWLSAACAAVLLGGAFIYRWASPSFVDEL